MRGAGLEQRADLAFLRARREGIRTAAGYLAPTGAGKVNIKSPGEPIPTAAGLGLNGAVSAETAILRGISGIA